MDVGCVVNASKRNLDTMAYNGYVASSYGAVVTAERENWLCKFSSKNNEFLHYSINKLRIFDGVNFNIFQKIWGRK